MECRYPLIETCDRRMPPDYGGPVFVSDIDKTYLSTRFSSMKGLAKIPVEFAVDKAAVAGMTEILRGVRRGGGPEFASAPLYFVSSSPPQLRPVIQRKMLLDGVQPDGFTFKDWARTVLDFRPGRLKDHLGFKLSALLYGRSRRVRSTEYLFGDDVERDAAAYSVYADIISGTMQAPRLEALLIESGVAGEDREVIQEMLAALPGERGGVGAAFILMVRSDEPSNIESQGRVVCAVRDAFQLGLALYERSLVDAQCVQAARAGVRKAAKLDDGELQRRLDDALARGLVSDERLGELRL